MNIVDPHIHLFNLTAGEYDWLKPDNPPFWSDKCIIQQEFRESDLSLTNPLTLDGFVHIEAGFNNVKPWKEVEWLETHCQKPFRSVANIDLTLPKKDFNNVLNELLSFKSIVGCRHILDDDFSDVLNHQNTLTNLKALSKNQLSFDLQMSLSNTQAVALFANLLEKTPDLSVIINHAGWPTFSTHPADNQLWLNGLKTLSQYDKCSIKCSGWEMIQRDYTIEHVILVIQQCIDAFGFNRVMLGSNFPLCLFSTCYQQFWKTHTSSIETLLALTTNQLNQLCSQNTKRLYKF